MKMDADTYKALEGALDAFLDTQPDKRIEEYRSMRSPAQFRWGILYASKFPTAPLYKSGLNDAHIDTALRTYFGHPGGKS